jgi:hypothetical protein
MCQNIKTSVLLINHFAIYMYVLNDVLWHIYWCIVIHNDC